MEESVYSDFAYEGYDCNCADAECYCPVDVEYAGDYPRNWCAFGYTLESYICNGDCLGSGRYCDQGDHRGQLVCF